MAIPRGALPHGGKRHDHPGDFPRGRAACLAAGGYPRRASVGLVLLNWRQAADAGARAALHVPGPQTIVQHRGFVFSNHVSFFDTLVMAYLLPMRFISKAEVKKWPFIGWIAAATGTQFVDREDKNNRATVRQTVADSIRAKQYPPIVVFPEGTRNPLDTLLPFRYGVFEIASEIEMPYLLCAIHYEQTEVMTWQSGKEALMTTVKRIVLRPTSKVWLIPLDIVYPHKSDSPQQLAYEARNGRRCADEDTGRERASRSGGVRSDDG